MIKLYDFLPCPFGQKVRIVLAEKGLSYELVQIDFTQGEQRKPDFLRLNPFGRVPVLTDEDITVYDSTIIAEYLEDEYPEPPLLPAIGSSALRARARTWEDFADTSFTPQVGQLMGEMGKPETDRDPARLQRFHRSIERVLDFLNHELQGQEYLAQQFSIADIGFVPRLVVLKDLGLDPAQNRPNVDAWLNRMIDRPSIQSLEGLTVQLLAGV
ncbi:MAG TPA: glutathione S-transferase family protein [Candidatus Binataceae bacterium]|jgi:glutathione S-transferase|nr:glutathione S-transferase family protein [Candidatus Binataceae bacterium]